MLLDVRYAVRSLMRDRVFTAVILGSLGLAIGASVSLFTVINSFLLRPLPVDDPGRLVALYSMSKARPFPGGLSSPDVEELRRETGLFAEVFGHSARSVRVRVGPEPPEAVWAESVTANYFRGLGAGPAAGRFFTIGADDRARNQTPEAVLSFAYWQRRFRGDPKIVGAQIRVNDQPLTIVGVGPRGFSGTQMLTFLPDLWVPLAMEAVSHPADPNLTERRGTGWLTVRARLQPGVTTDQARAAVAAIARRWNAQWPDVHRDTSLHVAAAPGKFHPYLFDRGLIGTAEALMFGLIGLILALASANAANLLLARTAGRAKEIALRASLGADRRRLLRQLLSESLVLGIASGLLGLLIAVWLNALQVSLLPAADFTAFDADEIGAMDLRVLAFAGGVSMLVALAFGTLPAWRATGLAPLHGLNTARGGSEAAGAPRLRAILVGAQVALCCVLLTCAGLFLRSLRASYEVDPGFQPAGLLTAMVDLNLLNHTPQQAIEFRRRLVEELRGRPGIDRVAFGLPLPLDTYNDGTEIVLDGRVKPEFVYLAKAGPGFFDTIGIPVEAGRVFEEGDSLDSPPVAVINRAMADRFWPGENPVGRTFRLRDDAAHRLVQVIGVVRTGKYVTLGEAPSPCLWLPLTQHHSGLARIAIRAAGPASTGYSAAAAALREAVRRIDPSLPLTALQRGDEYMARPRSGSRILTAISLLFGSIALFLATVGLYGVMQYSVSRRVREFGIRSALGATARDLGAAVLTGGLRLMAAGAVVGLLAAWFGSKILASLLVGVQPRDPWTFAGVMGVELIAALAACAIPARLAMRTNPADALRAD